MLKGAVAIGASVLVAVLLFGCGGGGDDRGTNAAGAEAGTTSTETGTETNESEAESNESGEESNGGESSSGAGAGGEAAAANTTPEGKAFAKQANAICEKNGEKITIDATKAIGRSSESESDAEVTVVNSVIVPRLEAEAKEIGALSPPSGDEEKVQTILDGYQEVIDNAKANPEKLVSEEIPYASIEEPADEYGLTECPL